jgi:uncharacterized protein YbjT (DUF2867 family)
MPEILVTGATGFVGKAVVQRLLAEDESQSVAVAVRQDVQQWPERVLPRVRVTWSLLPTGRLRLMAYQLSFTVPRACM